MRLRFPSRVSIPKTVAFAGAIVLVQQFEHTAAAFSLLFFAFTVLSAVNFNLAGGMNRPAGSYIACFSLLTVIAAVAVKALKGEPADTNLQSPLEIMTIYTCGMAVMLPIIVLKNRLLGTVRGLGPVLSGAPLNLTLSAVGCFLCGLGVAILGFILPSGSGTVLSALLQVNAFFPLGIILAAVDVVQRSDGRRSVNAVILIAGITSFVYGSFSFSKQGMFTPPAAWLIGCVYGRLRVRWYHAVSFVAISLFLYVVMVPIAQVGRNFATGLAPSQQVRLLGSLLMNRSFVEKEYISDLNHTSERYVLGYGHHGYYDRPGFADRLAMFQVDDGLVSWIDQNKPIGYAPVAFYFSGWIPHFIRPAENDEDEIAYNGNYYAHLVGGYLAPEDVTTGISFGFLGESYAIGGWGGIFLLAPALWFLLFVSVELIAGDLRTSLWGLLPMLFFLHVAPESLVGGLIHYIWINNIATVLAIWFCVIVAPVMGSAFSKAVLPRQVASGRRRPATGVPRSLSATRS